MSLKQYILDFEIKHRDDAELSVESIEEYRNLLKQYNWLQNNHQVQYLYSMEKHRQLSKLEQRKLFLLTQIRSTRTYRPDPALDKALAPRSCSIL
jgi:ribosome biogenesis protein Nip4